MTPPGKWQRHAFKKYKNVPTERDGMRFDSKKEAKRYNWALIDLGALICKPRKPDCPARP